MRLARTLVAVMASASLYASGTQVGTAATPGVRVVAGKPSEFAFALNTHVVKVGTIVFTIRNAGAIMHNFKVCSTPRRNTGANTCNGTGSRKLTRGQSAQLRVVFKKRGSYEYLCTVPGHAAAGMKGLLTVK